MTTALPAPTTNRVQYKPRRPTAMEILDEEGIKDWSDKVIFITGASSGIGTETACAFASVGAHLILPVRDETNAQAMIDRVNDGAKDGKAKITLLTLDLASLQSVRDCAARFLKLNLPLHILICNAGIMSVPREMKTKEGYDAQFGTNHLGHFLLFELLKENLLATSTKKFNSRVVVVASLASQFGDIKFHDLQHEESFDSFEAYGQSKTANILMSREIEKRYGAKGLHSTALHPGGIQTNLARHIPKEHFADLFTKFGFEESYFKTPEQGAGTTVWAACSKEFEGKGGEYLEDCTHSYALEEGAKFELSGYRSYAYDEVNAQKLYDISLKLVGLP